MLPDKRKKGGADAQASDVCDAGTASISYGMHEAMLAKLHNCQMVQRIIGWAQHAAGLRPRI
jgi:hypothetical protein